jgi:cell pole-organizing protein PopZ
MVAPRTADLTDVPRLRITAVGCQPMVAARMVVQLPLMGAGLQVTVADRIAGQRLRTVAEGPHRMAGAEQHRLTEAAVVMWADLVAEVGTHRLAVAVTAAAVEVGTVAEGTTKLRSHRIFQQRRRRAALLLWVR